jgi:type 1 glutamine amidotransferase
MLDMSLPSGARYRASMRTALVALVLVGVTACGGGHTTAPVDAAVGDGPAADGRPAGVIDGLCTGQPGKPRVLVYTYENLWRHISNYYARLAIYNMCMTRGFNVETSNDPAVINATRLADLDVVVFSISSGPGVSQAGRTDLEAWVRKGGGLVGLHSASATEPDWQFYIDNIGARFAGHVPGMQLATVKTMGPHPIVDGLATSFTATDEWYFFQSRPEDVAGMQMVLALDETTLPADYPAMYKVGYHPIGWAHDKFGERVFYTALGHNPDAFSDPTIVELIGRAIEWAAHQR